MRGPEWISNFYSILDRTNFPLTYSDISLSKYVPNTILGSTIFCFHFYICYKTKEISPDLNNFLFLVPCHCFLVVVFNLLAYFSVVFPFVCVCGGHSLSNFAALPPKDSP